jgi:hypothetical protein
MRSLISLAFLLSSLSFSSNTGFEPMILPINGLIPQDVINQFEAPLRQFGSGHRGIDLPAALGTEVLAPVIGLISFSGTVGYRESVTITAGDIRYSMEPVCSDLVEGTEVHLGEVIGHVCEPDASYQWHCESACLHFGTRNSEGYFSPLFLFGELAPSRLVPLGDQALG